MILYNVRCGQDHVFEAWFRDGASFDTQAAAGEIECPVCGDSKAEKAPMAPRVAASRQDDVPASPAEIRKALVALRRHVEDNCEHVGDKFAEEARKIHYGEEEKRNIYGAASDEEAKDLKDEGIEVSRIPWIEHQEH